MLKNIKKIIVIMSMVYMSLAHVVSAQTLINPEKFQQVLPLVIELKQAIDNDSSQITIIKIAFEIKQILDQANINISSSRIDGSDNFQDEEFLAVYEVEDLELFLASGEDDLYDMELWEIFLNSTDSDIIQEYLKYFAIYYDLDSNVVGYVESSSSSKYWLLAINIADLEIDTRRGKEKVFELMVHEFAHILSFNEDQIENIPERQCTTFYIREGCPKSDSYYQKFVEEFWDENDRKFSKSLLDEELSQDEIQEKIFEFYDLNINEFVSEYAATNEAEDFAESFSAFILNQPKISSKIKDKKPLFFYDFPELVELRDDVRRNLIQYIY